MKQKKIRRNLFIDLSGNTGLQLVLRAAQLGADSRHEIAINTIILSLLVSLVGFTKSFLFWVDWTILEGWEVEHYNDHSFIFPFRF